MILRTSNCVTHRPIGNAFSEEIDTLLEFIHLKLLLKVKLLKHAINQSIMPHTNRIKQLFVLLRLNITWWFSHLNKIKSLKNTRPSEQKH